MTYEDIGKMLKTFSTASSTVTVPFAYTAFPENDPNNPAPPPPFVCYYYDGDNDLLADNLNYQKIRTMVVELYTDAKDFDLENAVETMLNDNGLVFSKDEDYISSEKLYMTTYETEVILTNG